MDINEEPETTSFDGYLVEAAQSSSFVAGFGCYLNPAHVTKIEVVGAGSQYRVVAWFAPSSSAPSLQGTGAFMTGPLDSEREAFQRCNKIAAELFGATQSADWPAPIN